MQGIRHARIPLSGFYRICPLPKMTYLDDVNCCSPIGPAGMHFLRRYTDLGAEAEFAAIGEACGRIDINGGRVNGVEKPLGRGIAVCHNGFGMSGTVFVYVFDRFLEARHDFNGQNIIAVFRIVILFGGGDDAVAKNFRCLPAQPRSCVLF